MQLLEEGGMQVRGNFVDIIANTKKASKESGLVSTSMLRSVANLFAKHEYTSSGKPLTYVYKIVRGSDGINNNAFHRNKGLTPPYPWQEEMTYVGNMPYDRIVSYTIFRRGKQISNEISMPKLKKK